MSSFIELNVTAREDKITVNVKHIVAILPYRDNSACVVSTAIKEYVVIDTYKDIKKKIREAGGHFV